ncbi:MAG: radical SAM protein, partial [Syntrophaceae bacterium]|nr:radical SAM protein [Syntrophaceae bacterium]
MDRHRLLYSVIAKPMGPDCNLKCRYCFYLEKKRLFSPAISCRMSNEVLERFVRQYIESQDFPEIHFAWQGGEPTLLGIEFFEKVVAFQEEYAAGKNVTNSIQTNGTLLSDKWCEFLSEKGFLVGVSIDGPETQHNRYRVDRQGRPSFERVMRGVTFLKKHDTRFNTLTVVNDFNSRNPLELYRFLKDVSEGFIQFIPLVERRPDDAAKKLGMDLSLPPHGAEVDNRQSVMPWSVKPKRLGEFYIQIFD